MDSKPIWVWLLYDDGRPLAPWSDRLRIARAQLLGLSLQDYVQQIVAREAHVPELPARRTGQELIDICAEVRGLADDLDSSRNPSTARPVDLS